MSFSSLVTLGIVVVVILIVATLGVVAYTSSSGSPGSSGSSGSPASPNVPTPGLPDATPPASTPSASPATTPLVLPPNPPVVGAPTCDTPDDYYFYYAPDVRAAGMDAWEHWAAAGFKEGRKSCFANPNVFGDRLDSSGVKAPRRLPENQKLTSADGRYTLVMQSDGNFVGYTASTGKPFWDSGSYKKGTSPRVVTLQNNDGNTVIYDAAGKATWNTGIKKGSQPPYNFVIQTDRNIVTYDANGKPTWSAGSNA